MLILSLLLMVLWLGALVSGVMLGGLVHLFAVTSVLIVFLRGDRHPRSV